MDTLTSNWIGQIHLSASIIAMITGLYVLISTKGTFRHKSIGYVYAFSMIVLNITAFMIFRLYGKFGLFHWCAILSSLTLFAGLYPVIVKKGKNYLVTHFNFMYWSVIGLYSAFMAETFSRLPTIVASESGEPNVVFYKFVGIGTALVMIIGISFYIKYKPIWNKTYSRHFSKQFQ